MPHSWMLSLALTAIPWPTWAAQANPELVRGELECRFELALPLPESKHGVHKVELMFKLDHKGKGKGKGVLTLDPNGFQYDEFGNVQKFGETGPPNTTYFAVERAFARVELECRLVMVKENKKSGQRLFEITGPKITSRLAVMFVSGKEASQGRFLVRAKTGKFKYAINLQPSERRPPCHPGCFPAGTAVRVPDGTKPIERIHKGDLVLTIDADGRSAFIQVTDVFVTRNRLLKLHTDDGSLVTTETQPVGLEGGGFCPTGELKAGDRLWRWVNGERRAVAVLRVTPGEGEMEVFNLILGQTQAFIAGDFLVRSKPPGAQPLPR